MAISYSISVSAYYYVSGVYTCKKFSQYADFKPLPNKVVDIRELLVSSHDVLVFSLVLTVYTPPPITES